MPGISQLLPNGAGVGSSICLLVALPALAGAEEFHFENLDRTYRGFVQELTPIEMGVVEILLRSPEHELTLESHLASLWPEGGIEHGVSLHVQFSGHGLLDADLKVGAVEGKFEDELTLPSQALVLEGRIAIEGDPDGWTITLLEGPAEVEVQIQSRLASRIVPLCKQMALVLVRFDCGALEDALTRIQVPMPKPGAQFFLARDELTEGEAADLDAYLSERE